MDNEFEKNLQTKEGLDFLENYRTGKGVSIGSYETLVKDPSEEWKKAVRILKRNPKTPTKSQSELYFENMICILIVILAILFPFNTVQWMN